MSLTRTRIGGALAAVTLALTVLSCSDATIATPHGSPLTPGTSARSIAVSPLTWLPPLGTGSANPATFDPNAVSRVEVCVWVSSACSGAPVAQFAIGGAGGSGLLTANTAAGRYEASLNLLSAAFTTRRTYRIRALQGVSEVGGILFDAVRGRWSPTADDGTSGFLVAANALSIQFHVGTAPPTVKINEVESNGGVPGDWVELYNTGANTVDLSGYVFKDNDDTHHYTLPSGSTIAPGGYLVLEEASFAFGLGAPDAARLFNPAGALVDSYSWTTHAATTYGRCPNGTGDFITTTSSTKGAANDCSVAIPVRINEIESSGGVPGDWIELYNPSASNFDLSGFVLKDNDDTHTYTIPSGTTIASGGYLVFDEATFVFGLGAPDAARLFSPTGALVDSFSWTAHAATTYGRCPNGIGDFATTVASTKGTANSCGSSGPSPWPGGNDVTTVDGLDVFGSNLSGLIYEAGATSAGDVLWGARNGPGSLFRLVFDGTIWTPDANNGWSAGKGLHYTDGTGEPDTEDLTFTTGSNAGMYIVSERNNSNNSVSRPSILRYDVTAAGTTLTATNEWNLTADLPVVAANSGLEAITWIPDSFLVAQGFFDSAAGHLYNPADYADHAGGLFFVGLEGNGVVYVYALNHTTNGFKQIASISTGFPAGVMALQFDRELGNIWATCDDTCGGLSDIFEIDTVSGSPTLGHLKLTHVFARPTGMPNINNEGFAFAPQSRCVAGFKAAFWSDDSADNGHSIRMASVPCVKFP